MAAAFIPPNPSIKRHERHTYRFKREAGDLECIAGSKYQAWVMMIAHGYNVDIEKIEDLGTVDYSKPHTAIE